VVPSISGEHDWGFCAVPPTAPADWRQPILTAYQFCASQLQCVNPAIVELLHIWHKYEGLLLVDLPTELQLRQAMETYTAEALQHAAYQALNKTDGSSASNADGSQSGGVNPEADGSDSAAKETAATAQGATYPMPLQAFEKVRNAFRLV